MLTGSPEALAKYGAALKWKPIRGVFEAGKRGAIAVDAAYPARGTRGRHARLAIPEGAYRVDVAKIDDDRGELHAARLVAR